MSPTASGAPHDHNAVPGAPKPGPASAPGPGATTEEGSARTEAARDINRAGLEMSCKEQGLWLVEGHQVRKVPGRRGEWLVIEIEGGQVAAARYFEEALDALIDHLNDGRCGAAPPQATASRSVTP